jgi:hypothetical protein
MEGFRLEPCPPTTPCEVCGRTTGAHDECAAFTQSIQDERDDLDNLALFEEVPHALSG